ncbi:MAG TPA: nucleoside phosphorylase [Methanomicrobiales archaeon]|nr:nucleoside phosphorylase [Methanomicrobiales archaeon]
MFKPENLVDSAIWQKGLRKENVPGICILDPDGDIVRNLVKTGHAKKSESWPCYHTDMYLFTMDGIDFGIVGYAVGSPFAVLVAEEMFALGCRLLISMTSAGLIDPSVKRPCYMLIEKSIIDEGTSRLYRPWAMVAELDVGLKTRLDGLIHDGTLRSGIAWTTDAPFRETRSRIARMRKIGVTAVEMESSALYSFASAKKKAVICLAHITNEMGTGDNEFDKGGENNTDSSLKLISAMVKRILG